MASLIWKRDQLEGVDVLHEKQDLGRNQRRKGLTNRQSNQEELGKVKAEEVSEMKPPA